MSWITDVLAVPTPDPRIYQRRSGKLYINTNEFVRSEEGQRLINYFREHLEA